MDVLYIVGPGEPNDELRYSMRSLQNYEHGAVVISGYKPSWVRNVVHINIPKEKSETKHDNSTKNLIEGCRAELTENVLMMHDDMFIMEETRWVPHMHLGPISRMQYRHNALVPHYVALYHYGIKNPLNYEAHTPMVINRKAMVETITWAQDNINFRPILKRTVYGNLEKVGGAHIADVKVQNHTTNSSYKEWAYLSTRPDLFKSDSGNWIKEQFPEPSPYEG